MYSQSAWKHVAESLLRYIDPYRLEILRRVAARRLRRRSKRRGRTYTYRGNGAEVISPPRRVGFGEDFEPTVLFLERLRTIGDRRNRRKPTFVDLAKIHSVSIPAAIVLTAELHCWSFVGGRLRARSAERWSLRVRTLLSELGALELLKVRRVPAPRTNQLLSLTKLKSGNLIAGEELYQLLQRFSDVAELLFHPDVYGGLVESVENVVHHAYPDDHLVSKAVYGQRWWAASCLERNRRGELRMRFFVYDRGAGIPATLPASGFREEVRRWLERFGFLADDENMLRAAFEVGRTRTGAENRGLGLQKMATVVRGLDSAYLRVLSGRGEIVHRHNDIIESRLLPVTLGGTLVEWNLPASLAGNDRDDGNEADQHQQ